MARIKVVDTYANPPQREDLIEKICDRAEFAEIARIHGWRESVITLLLKDPPTCGFQMGAFWIRFK